MTTTEMSKEERILRTVKKVLTDIARDTYTPPNLRHPLSDSTIEGIRECLSLISAREQELAQEAGRPSKWRPRFVDEPQDTVVVPLDRTGLKKSNRSDNDDGNDAD